MRISILMPSFNSGAFIGHAVSSAVAQLGPQDELIVQDGGSDDESVDALEGLAGQPQVRLFREEDFGQADALNRAFARARGDLIGWLNADDLYTANAIADVRSTVAMTHADVITGSFQIVNTHGKVLRTYDPAPLSKRRLLRRGCYLFSGATFIRAGLLRDVGGFSAKYDYCTDYELFLKLSTAASNPVRVPSVLGALRWHEGTKSQSNHMGAFVESVQIRLAYSESLSLDRLMALRGLPWEALMHMTADLRFSSAYSAVRRSKKL